MFSVVVAGRLPLPPPQQVDETHAIFPLEDAASINHVVVFMTGQQAFPPGYAATVHLQWKTATDEKWLLLGCLKNEKPSAIFRIKGLTQASTLGTGASTASSAAIGLSVETIDSVDRQMATLGSKDASRSMSGAPGASMDADGTATSDNALALVRPGASAQDPAVQAQMALALAPKIASNIFDYLGSFAPDSALQTIALLKRWLEQFERKIKGQGIGFLANAV